MYNILSFFFTMQRDIIAMFYKHMLKNLINWPSFHSYIIWNNKYVM